MAWQSTYDHDGSGWAVDPEGISRLVRAYCRARAIAANSKTVEEKHTFGPNIKTVEIDWPKVKEAVNVESLQILDGLRRIGSFRLQFNRLIDYRMQTRTYEETFHKMQAQATSETMENINQSVERGEIGKRWAEGLRDGSAYVLVAGATALSGGAAVAILGTGAGLKGVAKYQDTGSAGAAVLEATSEMIVGVFEIKPIEKLLHAASPLQKRVLKIVLVKMEASLEAAKTLAEGGSAKEALVAAAGKAGLGQLGETASKLVGSAAEKLAKTAIPALVRVIPPAWNVKAATSALVDKGVHTATHLVGHGDTPHGTHTRLQIYDHAIGLSRKAMIHSNDSLCLADCLHALLTGPGTDVHFVESTAMRHVGTAPSGLLCKSR